MRRNVDSDERPVAAGDESGSDVPSRYPASGSSRSSRHEPAFREVVDLIQAARGRAFQAVNTALIDLYWQLGETLSRKISAEGWGKGTVQSLATYIQRHVPNARGFSAPNLWRMRQFVESYSDQPKLATLSRELPWSHNLLILSRCKRPEEREFYLTLAAREHWPFRFLEHQIKACLFERQVLAPPKLSTPLRELVKSASEIFRDVYSFDFLELPEPFSEADLQAGLVANLKRFLLELDRDFCFVGEEFPIQVGNRDYSIDLLFFHRDLRCLVAIELKVDEFEPAHLGQLSFYLEALDRDVRKPHENPSVGVLLCRGKDDDVVEYALSRTLSPAMVAEYQTKLPDRRLLQAKLHELLEIAEAAGPYRLGRHPARQAAPRGPHRQSGRAESATG